MKNAVLAAVAVIALGFAAIGGLADFNISYAGLDGTINIPQDGQKYYVTVFANTDSELVGIKMLHPELATLKGMTHYREYNLSNPKARAMYDARYSSVKVPSIWVQAPGQAQPVWASETGKLGDRLRKVVPCPFKKHKEKETVAEEVAEEEAEVAAESGPNLVVLALLAAVGVAGGVGYSMHQAKQQKSKKK